MKVNFLIIFLLSGFLLNAQEFYGGITAGMTASQVAGDVCSGYDKAGLYAGVYANLKVSKKSVFQLEIDYIQKGSRLVPKEENDYQSYKLYLQYIDVPVLYKYIISKRFTVEIGPVYGVFIKKYEEANFSNEVAGKPFNIHNLSVVVGMYYYITENFMFNLRSSNSVIPIREHTSGATRFFNRGQYNDVLIFAFVYQFLRSK